MHRLIVELTIEEEVDMEALMSPIRPDILIQRNTLLVIISVKKLQQIHPIIIALHMIRCRLSVEFTAEPVCKALVYRRFRIDIICGRKYKAVALHQTTVNGFKILPVWSPHDIVLEASIIELA